MKEASINHLKEKLCRKIITTDFYDEQSINRVCDDILSNYIAFCLYPWKEEKSRDCFLEFINKRGNLDAKTVKLIYDRSSISELLLKYDLFPLVHDAYSLAKTYEHMKSCVLNIFGREAVAVKNLDYRKSAGMFFTPPEIVRFIVENTFEDTKKKIIEKIRTGDVENAIRNLLELKIVDIACGTGSFLVETIEILKEIRNEIVYQVGAEFLVNVDYGELIIDEREFLYHVLTGSIYGVDIDKNAALLCAYNLLRYGPENIDILNKSRMNIRVGDSLTGNIYKSWKFSDDTNSMILQNGINWSSEFPDVFSREGPGFNIVIMNPPYGKVRLESHKGSNKNNDIGSEEREAMKNLATYFRDCGMYRLSTYGVLNFYKLMIERALALLRVDGSIGFIVPSTLLCDQSVAIIRRRLFRMNTKIIVEIPENTCFFEDVTQSFCIVISSNNGTSEKIKFKGGIKNKIDLHNNDFIELDVKLIRERFPDMLYVPLTDKTGIHIFNKIHSNGKLSDYKYIKNSRGEVDLTRFSNIISSSGSRRLIRGNNIKKYEITEDVTTKLSFIDANKLNKELGDSAKLIDMASERLVCKQIANQNKRGRLEFAIVPPNSILANSCNYIALHDNMNSDLLRYLLGFFNSSIVEWRFRITSTNNHINNYEIDDLPMIIPPKACAEWEIFERIVDAVKKIESSLHVDTIYDFEKPSKTSESEPRVFKTNGYSARKSKFLLNNLSAKIDREVFRLFGLNIDEMKYVLSTIGKDESYIQSVIGMD